MYMCTRAWRQTFNWTLLGQGFKFHFRASGHRLGKEQEMMVMHPPNERKVDRGNHEVPLHHEPGPPVQPNRRVPRLPRLQVDRLRQHGRPLHVVKDGEDQPQPQALALSKRNMHQDVLL